MKRIVTWLKVIGLVVWGLLTIASACGVWNYCPERAVKFAATIIFAGNIGLVAWLGIKLYRANNPTPSEEQ